ncbi:hypothetical protein PROFUN_07582 [Planoprotostelium fungivorum]|uniref:AB hydrolase-1 domain-containing protein n=1 Tax=Planoprotostelium fungivorum TaxID=1890364 RepID=A0A2P6NLY8_9EUKA|nr:hypothetical protein PROFUN_07582 [Planoprotostelium fungivorum]
MIGTSLPAYVAVRSLIFFFEAQTYISLFVITTGILGHIFQLPPSLKWLVSGSILSHIIFLYSVAELTFWFVSQKRVKRLQHPAKPPASSEEIRAETFMRTLRDPEDFIRKWFFNASPHDLKLDNIREWFIWALFELSTEQFENHPNKERMDVELSAYISATEAKLGFKFPPGYNLNAKSMRLTVDPVVVKYRPLALYMGVALLDLHSQYLFLQMKFTHYVPEKELGYRATFPWTLSNRSGYSEPSGLPLSYWYRAPVDPTVKGEPIVLIHGIGTGIHTYAYMAKDIAKSNPGSAIFVIELMHVSMRFVEKVPGREETVKALESILHRFGYSKAVIAGHSLGSVVATWVVRSKPEMVSGLVLLDPVCFLLHLPYVAYNFVYRQPKEANEWMLWWFASREAGIAWSLSRFFFWSENILWPDQIPCPERSAIILAEKDAIVPASHVWNYLSSDGPPQHESSQHTTISRYGNKMTWLWGYDHATVLLTKSGKSAVVDHITQLADGTWSNPQGESIDRSTMRRSFGR